MLRNTFRDLRCGQKGVGVVGSWGQKKQGDRTMSPLRVRWVRLGDSERECKARLRRSVDGGGGRRALGSWNLWLL